MHFEILRKEDEPLVTKWLQEPHVNEFWYGSGLQSTLSSITRFVKEEETLFTIWLAYDDSTPFAYLMTSSINYENDSLYAKYLARDAKAITIDLFIGNKAYLGKGLGKKLLVEILRQKFSDVTDVFIDPSVNNARAIHVYEKVGFQKVEVFIPPWDPSSQCILMHLTKKVIA
ncbi:MAG: GNAT family N-acetyltransferase [Verrucomicrobia bacterium]|nr:GNAT family N-acetyltransferase [Verrucomicrobiota bacterium]